MSGDPTTPWEDQGLYLTLTINGPALGGIIVVTFLLHQMPRFKRVLRPNRPGSFTSIFFGPPNSVFHRNERELLEARGVRPMFYCLILKFMSYMFIVMAIVSVITIAICATDDYLNTFRQKFDTPGCGPKSPGDCDSSKLCFWTAENITITNRTGFCSPKTRRGLWQFSAQNLTPGSWRLILFAVTTFLCCAAVAGVVRAMLNEVYNVIRTSYVRPVYKELKYGGFATVGARTVLIRGIPEDANLLTSLEGLSGYLLATQDERHELLKEKAPVQDDGTSIVGKLFAKLPFGSSKKADKDKKKKHAAGPRDEGDDDDWVVIDPDAQQPGGAAPPEAAAAGDAPPVAAGGTPQQPAAPAAAPVASRSASAVHAEHTPHEFVEVPHDDEGNDDDGALTVDLADVDTANLQTCASFGATPTATPRTSRRGSSAALHTSPNGHHHRHHHNKHAHGNNNVHVDPMEALDDPAAAGDAPDGQSPDPAAPHAATSLDASASAAPVAEAEAMHSCASYASPAHPNHSLHTAEPSHTYSCRATPVDHEPAVVVVHAETVTPADAAAADATGPTPDGGPRPPPPPSELEQTSWDIAKKHHVPSTLVIVRAAPENMIDLIEEEKEALEAFTDAVAAEQNETNPENKPVQKRLIPKLWKKVDAVEYERQRLHELREKLRGKVDEVDKQPMTGAVMVGFDRASMAHAFVRSYNAEQPVTSQSRAIIIGPREGVMWENIAVSQVEAHSRFTFMMLIFVGMVFLWGVPVGFLGSIDNLATIPGVGPGFIGFIDSFPPGFRGIVQAYLPTIVITVANIALPWIFRLFGRIGGVPNVDDETKMVVAMCCVFSVMSGIVIQAAMQGGLSQLGSVITDPNRETFFALIMAIIAPQGGYWYAYLIAAACIGCALELLQPPAMILTEIFRHTVGTQEAYDKLFAPREHDYAFYSGRHLFFFAIGMLFHGTVPFLLPFATLYTIVAYLVERSVCLDGREPDTRTVLNYEFVYFNLIAMLTLHTIAVGGNIVVCALKLSIPGGVICCLSVAGTVMIHAYTFLRLRPVIYPTPETVAQLEREREDLGLPVQAFDDTEPYVPDYAVYSVDEDAIKRIEAATYGEIDETWPTPDMELVHEEPASFLCFGIIAVKQQRVRSLEKRLDVMERENDRLRAFYRSRKETTAEAQRRMRGRGTPRDDVGEVYKSLIASSDAGGPDASRPASPTRAASPTQNTSASAMAQLDDILVAAHVACNDAILAKRDPLRRNDARRALRAVAEELEQLSDAYDGFTGDALQVALGIRELLGVGAAHAGVLPGGAQPE